MKKDSGAEFTMLQDNEIKVFDLKELEHCMLTLINQNKELNLTVHKYDKNKFIFQDCIYINIYDLDKARNSFPITGILELPYFRVNGVTCGESKFIDRFVNPFNLASVLVNKCDFNMNTFYATVKPYKVISKFSNWYWEYQHYFPDTLIKRVPSYREKCGFMDTSWSTFHELRQHLDMNYFELCKAIHEGQTLDDICTDRLGKKTYGHETWYSWLEFAKDYSFGKYYYGISKDYVKILQEFKESTEISVVEKPEIRFNYVSESKIPDSIVVTINITGIHYLSRDKQIEKIKEAKSVLDNQVIEALKKNKVFQKLNVPVNYLKVTRKTYTQAEELVYYFGWKEIPKDTAQAREDQV